MLKPEGKIIVGKEGYRARSQSSDAQSHENGSFHVMDADINRATEE